MPPVSLRVTVSFPRPVNTTRSAG